MDPTLSSVEAFFQYGEDERANGEQERYTVVRGRKVLLESLARSLAIRSGLFPASAEQDSSSQRGPMCRGVFFWQRKVAIHPYFLIKIQASRSCVVL